MLIAVDERVSGGTINPLIGSRVSAVPMAARVSQKVDRRASGNFLLMHAMGPNAGASDPPLLQECALHVQRLLIKPSTGTSPLAILDHNLAMILKMEQNQLI